MIQIHGSIDNWVQLFGVKVTVATLMNLMSPNSLHVTTVNKQKNLLVVAIWFTCQFNQYKFRSLLFTQPDVQI